MLGDVILGCKFGFFMELHENVVFCVIPTINRQMYSPPPKRYSGIPTGNV